MDFKTRYSKLNTAQKTAVDTIEGPLMVIAGPGTGKTELLSMRVANILHRTDTLPSGILCLTFTDSGAEAMRTRLASIIGPAAYEVAIHTFHSFGSEVIAGHREYFYRGAQFRPADEIASLEILTKIFDELDHTNQLSARMNDEYTYLNDARRTISELKRSGLTSDELLKILDTGDEMIETVEPQLQQIFATRISLKMLPELSALAQNVAAIELPALPRGITPLSHTLALSLAHAVDDAENTNSTKPITAWKNTWCEKNARGELVMKDRKRHDRLRQTSFVYYRYLTELEQAGLYDFDDMILGVIHAIETQPDLKANLQERYQYILVDEFQDTNLAQARLLLNLVDNPINEGAPNLMVVGDDDQAIYSFQGAEVGNIMQFLREFPSMQKVTLKDNYRSAPNILELSRSVITQGNDRLENFDDTLDKVLTPHVSTAKSHISLHESSSAENLYSQLATRIHAAITHGTKPESIAVLARKHSELEALVPYLAEKNILASYERQNNLLELDIVKTVTLSGELIREFHLGHFGHVDEMLPEFLSHPALNIPPTTIWQLSLKAYQEKRPWSELLSTFPETAAIHQWLTHMATRFAHLPSELMIDQLLGTGEESTSPFHEYFFAPGLRHEHPERLLENIDALSQLREHLKNYQTNRDDESNTFNDLLEFLELNHRYKQKITFTKATSAEDTGAIHLMTAHKAKGLEFEHVYVIGLDDHTWGARARAGSRKISYPENLPLAPHTGSRDEQLRLLYVALTRAKKTLDLSYTITSANGQAQALSDLLIETPLPEPDIQTASSIQAIIDEHELAWRSHLLSIPPSNLKKLLRPSLERYKLSSTHVNNFIDLTRGGPEYFLLQNLLRLPQSVSPNAGFGTAIHGALATAQTHLLATGSEKPLEDVIRDFETTLEQLPLEKTEQAFYSQKGADTLQAFLVSPYTGFSSTARAEFDFSHQGVVVDGARLTGKIDLASIDPQEKTLRVIDYKTGKPSSSWRGKTDYEKIKLHKYKQQLMFYRLLAEHSREYSGFTWTSGAIQFVEPDGSGEILPPLEAEFTNDEYENFRKLVHGVWQEIQSLSLSDTSEFSPDYKGILAFEQSLIDKYS